MADDLIGMIKGFIRSLTTTDPFEPSEVAKFFQFGLMLIETEAKQMSYAYIAVCTGLGVNPGLGMSRSLAVIPSFDFSDEMQKAGLGAIRKSPDGKISGSLKTSEFLAQFKDATKARAGLTPAKRDALRAELQKIKALPPRTWTYKSSYATVGVRG